MSSSLSIPSRRYYDDLLAGTTTMPWLAWTCRRRRPLPSSRSTATRMPSRLDTASLRCGSKETNAPSSVDETFVDDRGRDARAHRDVLDDPSRGSGSSPRSSATGFDPSPPPRRLWSIRVTREDHRRCVPGIRRHRRSGQRQDAHDRPFVSEHPEYFDGSLGELAHWDILGSEQLTSERMRVRRGAVVFGTSDRRLPGVLDGWRAASGHVDTGRLGEDSA